MTYWRGDSIISSLGYSSLRWTIIPMYFSMYARMKKKLYMSTCAFVYCLYMNSNQNLMRFYQTTLIRIKYSTLLNALIAAVLISVFLIFICPGACRVFMLPQGQCIVKAASLPSRHWVEKKIHNSGQIYAEHRTGSTRNNLALGITETSKAGVLRLLQNSRNEHREHFRRWDCLTLWITSY